VSFAEVATGNGREGTPERVSADDDAIARVSLDLLGDGPLKVVLGGQEAVPKSLVNLAGITEGK
jgi:hypothetical protein